MTNHEDLRVLSVGAYPTNGRAPHGGVEMAHYQLTRALWQHEGICSQVIAPTREQNAAAPESHPWARVTAVHLRKNPLLQARELTEHLVHSNTLKSADLVHVHGDARLAYKLQQVGQTPVILTVHGIAEEDAKYSEKASAQLRSGILKLTEGRDRRRVNHVIAISQYTTHFLDAQKQHVYRIGNPVAPPYYDRSPGDFDPNSVVFVGRIRRLKNVLGLIDAFHIIRATARDAQLHLIGPGLETSYGNQCLDRVSQLGLQANVLFHGSLGTDEAVARLRTAAVAVQPSLQENAPMALCEAAALGIPVVVTRAGDMPAMVAEYGNGIAVPTGDSPALAGAVLQLLNERRARRPVNPLSTRHAPPHVANETAALYRRVLGLPRRGTPRDED